MLQPVGCVCVARALEVYFQRWVQLGYLAALALLSDWVRIGAKFSCTQTYSRRLTTSMVVVL
eukprot:3695107-Amphidinium_carterae.1